MLTQPENEILTRIGPGTPMGNLFRQYWLPALLSSELTEPDGAPKRLRLLGEDLIAFRNTSGQVGILANNCSHRGASLFFGRNEENGLRCVYHGWKYDVDGRCVDMPNEPPEQAGLAPERGSAIDDPLQAAGPARKDKIRHRAYPAQERNGAIWVYMGLRAEPPAFPHYEWSMVPAGHYALSKSLRECNWAQALEGDCDDAHVVALHSFLDKRAADELASANRYYRKPLYLEVADAPYGVLSGSRRDAEEGMYNWRITPVLFPSSSMFTVGTASEKGVLWIRMWIPIDDEHTWQWRIRWRADRPLEGHDEPESGPGGYLPQGTHWYEQWQPVGNKTNDYLIDRQLERTAYCGVPSFPLQDKMATESMGPIWDRSREHLGTTDKVIVAMRRRLIEAAKALEEEGVPPPAADQPEAFFVRSAICNLPVAVNWFEASKDMVAAGLGVPATNLA